MNIEGLQGRPAAPDSSNSDGNWVGGSPKWTVFLELGLPLTVATILLPLQFDNIYRRVQSFAGTSPKLAKGLKWALPILLVVVVIVVVVTVSLEVTKQ